MPVVVWMEGEKVEDYKEPIDATEETEAVGYFETIFVYFSCEKAVVPWKLETEIK